MKEKIQEAVESWKRFWMNQIEVTKDQADHDNYFRRAYGVDANMKYHLIDKIDAVVSVELAALKSQNERLIETLRFYANAKENWMSTFDCREYEKINPFDVEKIDGAKYGGKRARQVLRELGIKEEGEV